MPLRAVHRLIVLGALAGLTAGCATPAPVGSVDLGGGSVVVLPGHDDQPPSVQVGTRVVPLNGFQGARLIGAWSLGGSPVLVLRGRTAGCDTTWDVVVVHRGDPAVHTINACERMMRVTALPGSIELASNDPDPLVWRFSGDTLLGPLPDAALSDVRPIATAHRRHRPAATVAATTQAALPAAAVAAAPLPVPGPPPVLLPGPASLVAPTPVDLDTRLPLISQPVGADVIPDPVPTGRSSVPVVPLR